MTSIKKVELLNTNILELIDIHALIKTIHIGKKPYAPWIFKNIKFMQQLRKFKTNSTPAN